MTKITTNEVKYFWAIMKAQSWSSMTINGIEVAAQPEGPHRFIPVFNTREQAVAWNGGEDNVVMMAANT
jgi:hypothetical protein